MSVFEELLNIDTHDGPSVRLDVQRNLQGGAICILELFVDVAQRYFCMPGLVDHVVKMNYAVFAIWLVQHDVDKFPG